MPRGLINPAPAPKPYTATVQFYNTTANQYFTGAANTAMLVVGNNAAFGPVANHCGFALTAGMTVSVAGNQTSADRIVGVGQVIYTPTPTPSPPPGIAPGYPVDVTPACFAVVNMNGGNEPVVYTYPAFDDTNALGYGASALFLPVSNTTDTIAKVVVLPNGSGSVLSRFIAGGLTAPAQGSLLFALGTVWNGPKYYDPTTNTWNLPAGSPAGLTGAWYTPNALPRNIVVDLNTPTQLISLAVDTATGANAPLCGKITGTLAGGFTWTTIASWGVTYQFTSGSNYTTPTRFYANGGYVSLGWQTNNDLVDNIYIMNIATGAIHLSGNIGHRPTNFCMDSSGSTWEVINVSGTATLFKHTSAGVKTSTTPFGSWPTLGSGGGCVDCQIMDNGTSLLAALTAPAANFGGTVGNIPAIIRIDNLNTTPVASAFWNAGVASQSGSMRSLSRRPGVANSYVMVASAAIGQGDAWVYPFTAT